MFAREAGRFVCATAGPQLEAIMAAHGSGAVARSRGGSAVLSVDIGGGTTKLAVCRDGEVAAVAVVNVGGRLVADDGGRITRLEEAGALVGDAVGLRLAVGQRIDEGAKASLAEKMAACLFEVIDRHPLSPLTRRLMYTAPLADCGLIDIVMFSGGVSEYIYDRERAVFGDLGKALGKAVRSRLASHPLASRLATPLEGIRATVIGAAQYTVQVSGSTIFTPQPDLLPIRNLPVLSVRLGEPLSVAGVAEAVRQAAQGDDADLLSGPLALAIRWPFGPSHGELTALGRGLGEALGGRQTTGLLGFDRDMGRPVGSRLGELAEQVGPPVREILRIVHARPFGQGILVGAPVLGDATGYHELSPRRLVDAERVHRGLLDGHPHRHDAVSDQEQGRTTPEGAGHRLAALRRDDEIGRLVEARDVGRREIGAFMCDRAEGHAERGKDRGGHRMRMDDGSHVGPRSHDLRVDEDLAVAGACAADGPPLGVSEEEGVRPPLLESPLVGFHPEGVGPGDAHGGVSPDVVALAGPGQNAAGLGEPLPEVGRTASRLSHPHSLRGSSDREPDLVETVARRSRLT